MWTSEAWQLIHNLQVLRSALSQNPRFACYSYPSHADVDFAACGVNGPFEAALDFGKTTETHTSRHENGSVEKTKPLGASIKSDHKYGHRREF